MNNFSLYLLQNVLTRAYLELVSLEDEVENESEEEDTYSRLEQDERTYKLHDNQRLDISSLDDKFARHLFRFTYQEMQRIATAMGLPEVIGFRQESSPASPAFSWSSVEALAIMLRRFAYPSQYKDLSLLFGVPESTIRTIFNAMVDFIYSKYSDGIRCNKKHLTPLKLRIFNDAIIDRGTCYEDVVGFIGGNLNAIDRLGEHQEVVDSSNQEKIHDLPYQAVVCPDGIIVSLCGPFAGAIHDQNMLHSGKILDEMEEQLDCDEMDGRIYALYGDPANREEGLGVITPFENATATDEQGVNQVMSKVQQCVEWEFKHIATLFAFLKFRPGQELPPLNRIEIFYVVCAFLKNVHTCLHYGNQTSSYFVVRTPVLEHYIEEITLK